MPFITVVRPSGSETKPLDQITVGGGKPKARQVTEATVFPVTFITLPGVSVNRGGT